ncbi:MAG: MATE family efflux transporter [Oscillospiraceae bacterium]|nr:MATE family efflux transporter [Oscillospiraceae bacterium]
MSVTQTQSTENKMGVKPVTPLLLQMALPMMLSMLAQSLYNVVDSIFVSQISEDALTAVSLAFPVQNLMIAFSVGTGVGINALLSRNLGEKNFDEANRAAVHGLLLEVFTSLLFMIFGLFFTTAFMHSQTNIEAIRQHGIDYLRIVTVGGTGLFLQVAFERLLQSTGRTVASMAMQLVGALTNILMDWVLIFGIGPFPALGIAGAAYATILGQWLAALVGFILNRYLNKDIKLRFKGFRIAWGTVGRIYAVGLPSILLTALSSVMTFGMNRILIRFSETAVAVFGVYFKLQSFVFMPIFGMNNAMVPILAYNYGARKPKRIIATMRTAMVCAVSIMLLGLCIFRFATKRLLMPFDPSEEMLNIGIPALQIISLSFLVAGINVISISSFQALGDGLISLLVAVIRQLFLLPMALLLAKTGELSLIWWAFPIAEGVDLLIALIFLYRQNKKKIKPLAAAAKATEATV